MVAKCVFWSAAHAQNLNAQKACKSLERPNIDFACVADRVTAYKELSPNAAAVAFIDQRYLYALGKENSYEAGLRCAFKDPMTAMGIMMAYEPLGGRKTERLEEAELEIYYRSFSDYSDDARTSDELAAMRGEAMNMSAEDFQALQDVARAKLSECNDLDANYCSALLSAASLLLVSAGACWDMFRSMAPIP